MNKVMAKPERVTEIKNSIAAFNKDNYQKDELLDEMFALQREMVRLTFGDEDAATGDLRLWNVEKHFEKTNNECGNIAIEKIKCFKNEERDFCNLIKAEISGRKGEARAFCTLEKVHSKNVLLKNIELGDGERKTEIDALVITNKAITIVEVKNTSKDIFIDENGNYFRTGEFMCWDCNIAEKMQLKEDLLKKAIESAGLDNIPVKSVVVFTNNRIKVQNKYRGIRTSFVSQLPCIIDTMEGDAILSDDAMGQVESIIRSAEDKREYLFEFDVEKFKLDFATIVATLEEAANSNRKTEEQVAHNNRDNVLGSLKRFLSQKPSRYARNRVAATIVGAVVYTAAMGLARKVGA